MNTKNNERKKLTQEKLSLETKKIEEINTNNNSIDIQTENALSIAKEDIRKLNEQIIKLKLEQETATNKMNKTLDETEDLKKEYQTQIKLLSEANSSQLKELSLPTSLYLSYDLSLLHPYSNKSLFNNKHAWLYPLLPKEPKEEPKFFTPTLNLYVII